MLNHSTTPKQDVVSVSESSFILEYLSINIFKRKQNIDSLSKWLKAVRYLILKRMKVLSRAMSVKATSVFKDPDVAITLSTIHDK